MSKKMKREKVMQEFLNVMDMSLERSFNMMLALHISEYYRMSWELQAKLMKMVNDKYNEMELEQCVAV